MKLYTIKLSISITSFISIWRSSKRTAKPWKWKAGKWKFGKHNPKTRLNIHPIYIESTFRVMLSNFPLSSFPLSSFLLSSFLLSSFPLSNYLKPLSRFSGRVVKSVLLSPTANCLGYLSLGSVGIVLSQPKTQVLENIKTPWKIATKRATLWKLTNRDILIEMHSNRETT